MTVEVNFDGLVGPTHHYGGLGLGNVASQANALAVSNPRAAALQGLDKMAYLIGRGLTQGVLLPHERPHVRTLRRFGYDGTDAEVLERAFKSDPGLVSAVSSASAMWTANAATVSPSVDTLDGKVHFTPANLSAHLHRAIEADFTAAQLRAAFRGEQFAVHDPLPATGQSGDEGAANHTRLTPGEHGDRGVGVFVFGDTKAKVHTPRQARHASDAVARQHQLPAVVTAAQNPDVIDAGVFHNDVIAVGDRDLLVAHEDAFTVSPEALVSEASRHVERSRRNEGSPITAVSVPRTLLPVADAVSSYLFNSQLLGLPDGTRLLLAPSDVRENLRASEAADWLLTQGVDEVHTMDLRQSMANGGGPACLRLRVVLTDDELASVHPGFLMTPARIDTLRGWVNRHYRDELHVNDLSDPVLLDEVRAALDDLTALMGVGSIYEFQRGAER